MQTSIPNNLQDGSEMLRPSLGMIMDLQAELQAMPQVKFPLAHFFSPGVYVRAILIREGHALTGAAHAKDHLCVLAGDMSVMTVDDTKRYTGFHVINSKAGDKHACYAHTDTFFATIHVTDLTDIDAIKAEVTLPDPSPFIEQECTP